MISAIIYNSLTGSCEKYAKLLPLFDELYERLEPMFDKI